VKGFFITFEGPDGSGKTTQIGMLKDYLSMKGYEVLITREPGGTQVGEQIRNILLDIKYSGMDETCEMLLYAAARAEHVNKLIKPALIEGKIVLCDRFVDSSYAYQGFGRDLGIEIVEQVNQIALSGIYPDLTILLNVKPELGLARSITAKGNADRLENENIEFHEKVRLGFETLSVRFPNRVKLIDAGQNMDIIFESVKHHVNCLIDNKNNI